MKNEMEKVILEVAPNKKNNFPPGIYRSGWHWFFEITSQREDERTGLIKLMGFSVCCNCGRRGHQFTLDKENGHEIESRDFCSLNCVAEFAARGDWYYKPEVLKNTPNLPD